MNIVDFLAKLVAKIIGPIYHAKKRISKKRSYRSNFGYSENSFIDKVKDKVVDFENNLVLKNWKVVLPPVLSLVLIIGLEVFYNDLVEKKVLIKDHTSKGRSVRYDLNWDLSE